LAQGSLSRFQHSDDSESVQSIGSRLPVTMNAINEVLALILKRLAELNRGNYKVANSKLKLKLGKALRPF